VNLQTVTAVCVYMTEGQRMYMFFFHILSLRSLAVCLNIFFEHMHLFILTHDVIYFNTSNKFAFYKADLNTLTNMTRGDVFLSLANTSNICAGCKA